MPQEVLQSQKPPDETAVPGVSVLDLDSSPEKNASLIVVHLLQAVKGLPKSIAVKNPKSAIGRVSISVTSQPEDVPTSETSSVPVGMTTVLISKGESSVPVVSVKHDIDDSSHLIEINLPRVLTVTLFPGTDREKIVFHASGDAQSLNSIQGIDPKKGGLIHVCDLNGESVDALCRLFEEAKRQHAEALAAKEKQQQEEERQQREAERLERTRQQKVVSDALQGLLKDVGIEL